MQASSWLKLSILAAIATILLKMVAWWLTDSVGYLSDALESFVNLAGATFAFAMVSLARMPADSDHPFGHGKAEYMSAGFEGILIFAAALGIIFAAVERWLNPVGLSHLGSGMAFSLVSTGINFIVAQLLLKASREHRSLALEADARHLMTDVWTSFGVIAGVGLATYFEYFWLDPLVAIGVALNILREGWGLIREAFDGLMDRALPADDQALLSELLAQFNDRCQMTHLRTRVSGPQRFATVNVLLPGETSVAKAHDLADEIEALVDEKLGIVLTTHIEPISRID